MIDEPKLKYVTLTINISLINQVVGHVYGYRI